MTSQQPLFDASEFAGSPEGADESAGGGTPRLRYAVRDQISMHCEALDDLIAPEHVARSIWAYVSQLDLSALLKRIKAVEGHEGRAMTDPRILLALWIYATVEGVGSARELARLCQAHAAYKWIAGGVSLNYHSLSDFRADQEALLDELLTRSVASLMHAGVVDLKRVAHDGVRVRANAGSSSYRSRSTLERCLAEATEQVRQLKADLEADPAAYHRRNQAAQERAAQERADRVSQALDELKKIEAKKPPGQKDSARASTTDPQSRRMKMSDGGFRPAYNVQFATDARTLVVVGVDVTNVGSDKGQLRPMHAQIQRRYGKAPDQYLADGDFVCGPDIDHLDQAGTTVYMPPKKSKSSIRPLDAPREGDSAAVISWRKRMATPEAQQIYRHRASSAECVNAQARNRGLRQFVVRGPAKVRAVALLHALTQNVMRTMQLCPAILKN